MPASSAASQLGWEAWLLTIWSRDGTANLVLLVSMPRQRGLRKRIAPNIYKDAVGYAVVVRVGPRGSTQSSERRFPIDTTLTTLKRERDDLRAALRENLGKTTNKKPVSSGTLAEDVELHLATARLELESWKSLRSELKAWVALYGDWQRDDLTHREVREARVTWLREKKARKTIDNRVLALQRLYHALDGPKADTPCDGIKPMAQSGPPLPPVEPDLIVRVAQRIEEPVALARYLVQATTGARPIEVGRAKASDIDLKAATWYPRTAKKGWRPPFPLNGDMVAAWRFFFQVGTWGEFDTGRQADVLRAAGWPKNIEPYRLRHSFGVALSTLAEADLADIKLLMGHVDASTTRRFYVPGQAERLRALVTALETRFGRQGLAPRVGPLRKLAKSA